MAISHERGIKTLKCLYLSSNKNQEDCITMQPQQQGGQEMGYEK
jgi:hypothetical protein